MPGGRGLAGEAAGGGGGSLHLHLRQRLVLRVLGEHVNKPAQVLLSAVLLSAAHTATHLLSRLSNISLVCSGRPTSWGARELNTGPGTEPNCLQQEVCYLPRLWCAVWRVTHWELNLAALCSSLSSGSRTRAKLAAASLAATVSASLYTWTNQRQVL